MKETPLQAFFIPILAKHICSQPPVQDLGYLIRQG